MSLEHSYIEDHARPVYSTLVLSINNSVPRIDVSYPTTIHIQLRQSDYEGYATEMGSLVVISSDLSYTHIGMVTHLSEQGNGKPAIAIVNAWTFTTNVPLLKLVAEKRGNLSVFPRQYSVDGAIECGSETALYFQGNLKNILPTQALQLRAHIVDFTPKKIEQIYWTDHESRSSLAKRAAQEKFEDLANALIDSL